MKELAAAAEHLCEEGEKPGRATPSKCRLCGKAGHMAASCPLKRSRSKPATTNEATLAPVEEVEAEGYFYEEMAEEDYEELEDYEDEIILN